MSENLTKNHEMIASQLAWTILIDELYNRGLVDKTSLLERFDELDWMEYKDDLAIYRDYISRLKNPINQ